jgi:hypothetical protein
MNDLSQFVERAAAGTPRWRFGIVLALIVLAHTAACTAGSPGGDDDNASNASAQCQMGERATDYASCTSDDQCYSGYCCIAGVLGCGRQGNYPGYCTHPNTSAFEAGHGYSCDSDADCAKVVPDDFIQRGGGAHCYKDNVNNVSNGCGFNCTPSTKTTSPGSGGTSSGGTGSGAGGNSSSSGGTSSGGTGSTPHGGGG